MSTQSATFVHPDLSYKIIGVVYQVFNELGSSYQEKYYQRAVAVALRSQGMNFKEQVYTPLAYKGTKIGSYFLDFLVEDLVILEIKKGDYFVHTNIQQVLGYLKSTGLQLGILANFAQKGVKIKRIVNIL